MCYAKIALRRRENSFLKDFQIDRGILAVLAIGHG